MLDADQSWTAYELEEALGKIQGLFKQMENTVLNTARNFAVVTGERVEAHMLDHVDGLHDTTTKAIAVSPPPRPLRAVGKTRRP